MAEMAGQAQTSPEILEFHRQQLGLKQIQIDGLNKQVKDLIAGILQAKKREEEALRLLKNIVDGLRLLGVDVPGYEDALAFFMQEKMLTKGGDIEPFEAPKRWFNPSSGLWEER